MFITPEYNYGYPATIKNAIDYLHQEWKDKPVGFVSYGGIAAGTRAVQQLKQVVTTLKMVPVFESVNIPFHTQFIRDGQFHANEVLEQAAPAMLDELLRLDGALRPLRAAPPRAAPSEDGVRSDLPAPRSRPRLPREATPDRGVPFSEVLASRRQAG